LEESILLQEDKEIEAMVKQSAISNPQAIVDAYSDKVNGSTKVVALALSKNYQNQRNQNSRLWTNRSLFLL
jgi:hypothetical protein